MGSKYRLVALLWLSGLFLMGHHPPYPAVLAVMPAEQEWSLVTTSGFIKSDEPAGLMCKEAFGVEGKLYSAVLGPSHFAVAAAGGVAVTRDGCDVNAVHPVEGRVLEMDGAGNVLVVAVSDAGGDGLYASLDGGDSLQKVATFSKELTATAVGLVDASRAVVSAYVAGGEQRGEARLLMVDLVEEQVDSFEDPEGLRFPYIFAASEGRVAWAARGDFESFMLWGPVEEPDRYRVDLAVWPLFAAFGNENGELWISGLDEDGQGAGKATAQGLEIEDRLGGHHTNCAIPDGGGLWVCSDGFAEAYEVWRLDGVGPAEPFYRLTELEGARQSCPEGSAVAEVCPDMWELVRQAIPSRELIEDEEESGEQDGGEEEEMNDFIRNAVDWESESQEDQNDDGGEESVGGCRQSEGSQGSSEIILFLIMLGFLLIHAGGYLTGVQIKTRDR